MMSREKMKRVCYGCKYYKCFQEHDFSPMSGEHYGIDIVHTCTAVKNGDGIIYSFPYCPIFCRMPIEDRPMEAE